MNYKEYPINLQNPIQELKEKEKIKNDDPLHNFYVRILKEIIRTLGSEWDRIDKVQAKLDRQASKIADDKKYIKDQYQILDRIKREIYGKRPA